MHKNISRADLVDLMTFDRIDFEKTISLSAKKKIISKWEVVSVQQAGIIIIDGDRGKNYPSKSEFTDSGYCVFLNAKNIVSNKFNFSNTNFISKERDELLNNGKLKRDDLVLMTRGTIGKIAHYNDKIEYEHVRINSGMLIFRSPKKVFAKYLCILFSARIVQDQFKNLTSGSAVPQLPIKDLTSIKFPLPPKEIQGKIVSEIEDLEKKQKETIQKIEALKLEITDFMDSSSGIKSNTKLENIALLLKRGKSAKYGNSQTQIIKSGQARGFKEFDFSQKHFVIDGFILDERKLEKGDILINSSGVGTAGRVTLFNLEGDFVVDSHITILRADKTKALPDFVLYSLAQIGFKNIEAMAMGQSGQIELTIKTIQNIKIPIPSLSEQKKIISSIEEIESNITELEKEISTIPDKKDLILKKYLE